MKQLLIGIGSPYGDDQLGWKIIEELEQQTSLHGQMTFYKSKGSGTDWYSLLAGHDRLVFFDAQISPNPVGSITPIELNELDQAIAKHSHSTHGVSLSESILLADSLGLLNMSVQIFGISVGAAPSIDQLSDNLSQNLSSIAAQLLETIK